MSLNEAILFDIKGLMNFMPKIKITINYPLYFQKGSILEKYWLEILQKFKYHHFVYPYNSEFVTTPDFPCTRPESCM
mgnify:CR=1 FL=1